MMMLTTMTAWADSPWGHPGSGTANDPYQISTAQQCKNFAEMVARLGANPVPVKTGVSGKYDKSVYEAAEGSFPYVYYEIDGMGHNDFTSNTEDGNSSLTLWKFFKQYTLDMPYNATRRWRRRIEEEGFVPQEHGWIVNRVTTLQSYGDQKSDDNENVYHSLQLTAGTYKLTFRSEGEPGTTIDLKIRKLPSNQVILEKTLNVYEAPTLFFKVDDAGCEYKITFVRKKRTDEITITDLSLDALSDEEASGISERHHPQQQDEGCYSLSGIAIPHPSKGIYIKKGKKMVVQ